VDTVKHWTGTDADAFIHAIASDFVAQIETKLESENISRRQFARLLHVSPGRVSQTLNDPSGFNLRTIVNYVRALGMKAAIVAYSDDDPNNDRGPINAEVFNICWRQSGRPQDLAGFSMAQVAAGGTVTQPLRVTTLYTESTETKGVERAPLQLVIAENQRGYENYRTDGQLK
jgi:predicted XRE-type DNA-binding protein